MPRSAPTFRMWRTSARVSMSQITGILCRFKYNCAVSADLQLDETCENSRTISDSMYGREDSSSSTLAPTFPMCG
jgi:hypothetical protein